MRYHSGAQASVIAHRSPRETRPPETEISSILYSKTYLDPSDRGVFYILSFLPKKMTLFVFTNKVISIIYIILAFGAVDFNIYAVTPLYSIIDDTNDDR